MKQSTKRRLVDLLGAIGILVGIIAMIWLGGLMGWLTTGGIG